MLRTSLVLLLFGVFSSFTGKTFENKSDAIDYLNNSNIWIAGMPVFSIDDENGFLHIKQSSSGGTISTHLPMAEISALLIQGKTVTVELNCKQGAFCCTVEAGNKNLETDGVTLVLNSTFDDGNYHDKYVEHGAKITEALDYLISFYKP